MAPSQRRCFDDLLKQLVESAVLGRLCDRGLVVLCVGGAGVF